MMASVVYALCALTSILCAVLLVRGYAKQRDRFLLLSALCFCGLAANNILLFTDLVIVPFVDLSLYRNAVSAVALLMLLIGLIREGS